MIEPNELMAGKMSHDRDRQWAAYWTRAGSSRPPRRQLPEKPSSAFDVWLSGYRRQLEQLSKSAAASDLDSSDSKSTSAK